MDVPLTEIEGCHSPAPDFSNASTIPGPSHGFGDFGLFSVHGQRSAGMEADKQELLHLAIEASSYND